MAHYDIITPTERHDTLPQIQTIWIADLKDVVSRGIDDFIAMPTHVIFLCLVYPVIGVLIGRALFGLDLIPLLYPVITGFALVGPFAGIGLYELSRRREQGLDTSWRHAFDIVHSPSFPSILLLGALMLAIFVAWVATANWIYTAHFGDHEPTSFTEFAKTVTTTPQGRSMILIGNAVGFVFAAVAFLLSVVSFPLLLDRNIGVSGAMATSVRAVAANPVVMTVWAAIIAVALLLAALPLLLGLPLVLPVLGHASWHLYRRIVAPDERPRPPYQPKERGVRYGAQFPAGILFPHHRDKR